MEVDWMWVSAYRFTLVSVPTIIPTVVENSYTSTIHCLMNTVLLECLTALLEYLNYHSGMN